MNLDKLTEDEANELLGLLDSMNLEKTFLDLEPHAAQEVFMTSDAQETLFFGANQIGKTEALIALVLMFATGDYPDWFPEHLKMPVPNRGRLCGNNLKDWVMEIVEPKLERLLPKSYLKPGVEGWKHNPQTKSLDQLVFRNGSVIDIMSYQQDQMTYESWTGHWAAFDEPPPRDMYVATVRGLAAMNGKTFLSLTPLTQPWIAQLVDQCKESKDFHGKTFYEGSKTIDIGDGKRYQAKARVIHALASENLSHLNHRGKRCGGLTPEGLAFFQSTLKPDEIEARIYGKFVHLQGLIYKEFDESVHVIEDEQVPKQGSYYCVLDPADSKPHAVAWYKVDPMNKVYCVRAAFCQGNLDSLVNFIKQLEAEMGIAVDIRIIDPQKGNTPTAVSGQSWQEELDNRGLYFETDVNNDISLGHQKVRSYLNFDRTKPIDDTNTPHLFFARHGAQDLIFSLRNYVYRKNTKQNKNDAAYERPEEKYKDLPDTLRYLIMYGPEFIQPIQDPGFYNTKDFSTSMRKK